jgi:hypothetical protein
MGKRPEVGGGGEYEEDEDEEEEGLNLENLLIDVCSYNLLELRFSIICRA